MVRLRWLYYVSFLYVFSFWATVLMFFNNKALQFHDGRVIRVFVKGRAQYNIPSLRPKSQGSRRNLLVVAHGRSGSTFAADIFNHHPDVFYMYEPLQTVERTHKRNHNKNYAKLAEQFLRNVFQCKFGDASYRKDIEKFYRDPGHPRVSSAMGSPPLCKFDMADPRWTTKTCPPITQNVLETTCRKRYEVTVMKLLMSRIPNHRVDELLAACDQQGNTQCKIVFLIRDPRAVIPSAKSVGFYREKDILGRSGTRMYSYKLCKQTEDTLEFLRNLPSWARGRIKLLRYEDLAILPLEGLPDLFKFAGLSVLESVRVWLNKTTHPSKEEEEKSGYGPVSTLHNAWEAVNRWRWKVDAYEIYLIERYCKHVMEVMGYIATDGSYELQRNLDIPLFKESYIAQKWGED